MAAKVLVVGSGGREHALALALLDSPSVGHVVVTPGNGGTVRAPASLAGKILETSAADPTQLARDAGVDLVVVGPEVPLVAGLVDRLQAQGTLVFGPTAQAARLEGSKAYMKEFASRHRIATASYEIVRDPAELEGAVQGFRDPPVVKADGLAAGKGVIVADSHEQALSVARGMLSGELFGDAGKTVVLEERILGAEASLHVIADGERYSILPVAQDHKRIGDGDTGPNTGGMGTYAPAPIVTPELRERIEREIIEPAIVGMRADGTPYRGALFAGIMVTPHGEPFLLEFNVRFGDPETQVLLSSTRGDWYQALSAAARGELASGMLEPSGEHALCVVLAASGYPDKPRTGDVISGVDEAERVPNVRVYHAGTTFKDGRLVTSGGRVLGVTARGKSLREAHDSAYRAAALVQFAGVQYRKDIGARALTSQPNP